VYGIGYDVDRDGFALTDGTVFDADGIAVTGASDGETAVDPDDLYAEGFFTGFWNLGLGNGNPFDGGSWSSALTGVSGRVLSNGSWDSLAFTPTFSNAFAENPVSASVVPEVSALHLVAVTIGLLLLHRHRRALTALMMVAAITGTTMADSPFATEVVSYVKGAAPGVGNPAPYQTDGSQSLGSPARDAGFGSQVGVFYSAFLPKDLVIIGPGGELVVKFDHPVENDSKNPFGIDLLVFGNAFLILGPGNVAGGVASEPGRIAVSSNGSTWLDVPGLTADGLFPTMGFVDSVYNGFGNFGGTIPTDFTKPVDPSLNVIGKTESEIVAGYAGSGGGLGIDIGVLGLSSIQFVRISQPTSDTWTTEIDAFADVAAVPEPGSFALVGVVALGLLLRRRQA
jgi:hypothetical protein